MVESGDSKDSEVINAHEQLDIEYIPYPTEEQKKAFDEQWLPMPYGKCTVVLPEETLIELNGTLALLLSPHSVTFKPFWPTGSRIFLQKADLGGELTLSVYGKKEDRMGCTLLSGLWRHFKA